MSLQKGHAHNAECKALNPKRQLEDVQPTPSGFSSERDDTALLRMVKRSQSHVADRSRLGPSAAKRRVQLSRNYLWRSF